MSKRRVSPEDVVKCEETFAKAKCVSYMALHHGTHDVIIMSISSDSKYLSCDYQLLLHSRNVDTVIHLDDLEFHNLLTTSMINISSQEPDKEF